MYVLNKTLQNQIPTEQLFTQFLGPTQSVIEETIIDDGKQHKKKFVKKYWFVNRKFIYHKLLIIMVKNIFIKILIEKKSLI